MGVRSCFRKKRRERGRGAKKKRRGTGKRNTTNPTLRKEPLRRLPTREACLPRPRLVGEAGSLFRRPLVLGPPAHSTHQGLSSSSVPPRARRPVASSCRFLCAPSRSDPGGYSDRPKAPRVRGRRFLCRGSRLRAALRRDGLLRVAPATSAALPASRWGAPGPHNARLRRPPSRSAVPRGRG